jgi:hypothetical protein
VIIEQIKIIFAILFQMSTVIVKNVPNPAFALDEVSSDSASIASRKQMQYLPIDSLAYYKYFETSIQTNAINIAFNLTDPESFLDPKGIYVMFQMQLTTNWPFCVQNNPEGRLAGFPSLDQTISALIREVSLTTSTGMEIDKVQRYNIWASIIEQNTLPSESDTNPFTKASPRHRFKDEIQAIPLVPANLPNTTLLGTGQTDASSQIVDRAEYISQSLEGDNSLFTHRSTNLFSGPTAPYNALGNSTGPLSTPTLSAANTTNTAVLGARTTQVRVVMRISHLPFFNRFNMIPLFLFKNGIRLTIQLENPKRAFYVKAVPRFLTQLNSAVVATATDLQEANLFIPGLYEQPITSNANSLVFSGHNFVQSGYAQFRSVPLRGFACVRGGAGAAVGTNGANQLNLQSQSYAVPCGATNLKIDYTVFNPVVLCDLVKPSAEVGRSYLQMYQSAGGIPFKYTRVGHTSFTLPAGSTTGVKQINIPVSARSMRGMFVVFQDQETDSANSIMFPHLSNFMHLRLYQAQLTIGGTSFPQLPITFNGLTGLNGTSQINGMTNLDYTQILDQYPFFRMLMNTQGSSNITPKSDLSWLDMSMTNYSQTGVVPYTTAVKAANSTTVLEQAFLDPTGNAAQISAFGAAIGEKIGWKDTRNFVLAFDTQRDDNSWGTGVDTTQSGSVNLYLNFTPTVPYPNQVTVRVFYLFDSVLTVQQNGNLVRS